MKTATVSDFRAKMKERLNEIQEDQDILILSGPKKMDFVVLTLAAYNSMEETAHLLSSSENAGRLMESIAQDKKGNARVHPIGVKETAVPEGSRVATATKRKKKKAQARRR